MNWLIESNIYKEEKKKNDGIKMQLTQQIKIRTSPAQELVLQALSEKCRLIYNFALKERKEAFDKNVKGINYIKQQNDLPQLKNKFPEYNWVYSKVLQYALRTLDVDFKSFFALNKKGDKDARPPKFKGKKFFISMCSLSRSQMGCNTVL